jgi:hypothetical protein
MPRTPEEKLLNPEPGSKIAEAADFGIDLSQLAENLRFSPAERIKRNDAAANSMIKFARALRASEIPKKRKPA